MAASRRVLEDGDEDIAVYLAHQAVEILLKAAWLFRGRDEPPRSHDVVLLSTHLDAPEAVLNACRRLRPHYLASRYPDAANGDPAENYDEIIAGELVALAGEVFEWASNLFPP